jgi:hypothetical protein
MRFGDERQQLCQKCFGPSSLEKNREQTEVSTKVKLLSPCNQFMFAEHSPNEIVETGMPIRLAEKRTGNVLTPN